MSLLLVSTPIAEEGTISEELKSRLLKAFEDGETLLIEDEKPARRRWRAWDLPREAIETFVPYNEHTRQELDSSLIQRLKSGEKMLLMSDGGTPGFCDPGRSLIEKCHQNRIKVSITESFNSLIPAVALSGFTEGAFEFHGFPPRDKEMRKSFFKKLFQSSSCSIFMDTPYRLDRVLDEVVFASENSNAQSRRHAVVMDINRESEAILWGDLKGIKKEAPLGKREFLWVVEGK